MIESFHLAVCKGIGVSDMCAPPLHCHCEVGDDVFGVVPADTRVGDTDTIL